MAHAANDEKDENLHLQPGTLWQRAQAAQAHALATGALKPIPAVRETVEESGIVFVVWRLAAAETVLPGEGTADAKPAYSDSGPDPFLPYDPDVFVAGMSATHVCLLNKYNILDGHLLLVTHAFEQQTTWLSLADFEAVATCMAEFDGLAFYNGGKIAGASQRHKHVQYVRFPLGEHDADLPISPALATSRWADGIGRVAAFPFAHALGRLERSAGETPAQAAERMLALYWKLLAASGIQRGTGSEQTRPYNLLATREWMMIVPRSYEAYAGISVNALGFAGSLLVHDDAQLQLLREVRAAHSTSVRERNPKPTHWKCAASNVTTTAKWKPKFDLRDARRDPPRRPPP